MIVQHGTQQEAMDLDKAQEVGRVLNQKYPNHPWMVVYQGHVLIVRHMAINELVKMTLGREGFGFVLKHLNSHSATDLSHSAMIAGGQMLEAFGLKRGAWDGTPPTIPKQWTNKNMQTRTFQ